MTPIILTEKQVKVVLKWREREREREFRKLFPKRTPTTRDENNG
jgi:hypothetical protein